MRISRDLIFGKGLQITRLHHMLMVHYIDALLRFACGIWVAKIPKAHHWVHCADASEYLHKSVSSLCILFFIVPTKDVIF